MTVNSVPVFFDLFSIDALNAEIVRAQAKHGWHNTPLNPRRADRDNLPILVEEVGEVARILTYDHGYDPDHLVAELIQVAAMALAWAEGAEKRGEGTVNN